MVALLNYGRGVQFSIAQRCRQQAQAFTTAGIGTAAETEAAQAIADNEYDDDHVEEWEQACERTGFPMFDEVFCSDCGRGFGPGSHGFSDCKQHDGLACTSR